MNLAFEATGAAVFGVDRKIFTRRLAGQGQALGVRFRPGDLGYADQAHLARDFTSTLGVSPSGYAAGSR